jgi:proteasome lid subunit RPN8/RPN11
MIHCDPAFYIKLSFYLADDKVEQVVALIGKMVGEDYYVTDVIPARNEDPDPANMFYVSNQQVHNLMVEANRKGCTILGFAHSHPSHHPSTPSVADIRFCRHNVNAVYHPSTHYLTWFNDTGEIGSLTMNSTISTPVEHRVYTSQ